MRSGTWSWLQQPPIYASFMVLGRTEQAHHCPCQWTQQSITSQGPRDHEERVSHCSQPLSPEASLSDAFVWRIDQGQH